MMINNRESINKDSECGKTYLNDDYESYIAEYYGNIVEELKDKDYACAIVINAVYAILSVRVGEVERLLREVKNIKNLEGNIIYSLSSVSPLEVSNINKYHNNSYLNLNGEGVIVGLIDTGIDYLLSEFMKENGKTRILNIWDQTINAEDNISNYFGSIYTEEKINIAIEASKKGEDPYKIVPSKDENGHGTQMAGIIGASGVNIEPGAAPNCEFAVVKLQEASNRAMIQNCLERLQYPVYQTSDILLAINYLYELKQSLKRPMIIYIPLATNLSAHDASSIVERYVDSISRTNGTLVVTGCGNQGQNETHYRGKIERTGDTHIVELRVDPKQKDLLLTIWANKPDRISIGLVSPSGEIIEPVPARIKKSKDVKLIFENTNVRIIYDYPNDYNGDENILVVIRDIRPGIWKLNLVGEYILFGDVDIWIYQKELLGTNTGFLNSDPYITLTVPATSYSILSAAYYDQNTNSVVVSSGRGYTRDNRIKPDVTVGGINVQTISPGGNIVNVSGASVAAAVLAGGMALFYQWAIVEGNDPNIYASKIKSYLYSGTIKRKGDIYPNREWGYGIFNLEGMFDTIRGINSEPRSYEFEKLDDTDMFSDKIFIRIP